MKKIITTSIVAMMALAQVGCVKNSDLDVSEYNVLGEKDINPESLVIAAYGGLDYRFNTGGFEDNQPFDHAPSNWVTCDIRSGDAYKGGGGTGDNPGGGTHQLETHDVFPTSENGYNLWCAIYYGLSRVNAALRTIVATDIAKMPTRDIRIGELYVLRAHFYFEAMKNFGTIVWYDETTPVTELTSIPNSFDHDFIWSKIEGDLTRAIDLLPDTQEDLGRANGMVARAFLAKAHIFQSEWSDVLPLTEYVINNGPYRLVEDIEKLYSEPGYGNEENIFAIQYSINDGSQFGNINYGDILNSPDSPQDDPAHPYLNGDDFHKPSQNLANAYKVGADGLPLFESYNNVNVTMADMVDPRIDHIIGRNNVTWKDWSAMPQQASWNRDAATYGNYVRKKNMISPNSDGMASNPNGFPWALGNLDHPIIKYSDLLLWRAEALIESDFVDDGVKLINDIRQRAMDTPYVKDFNNPSNDAANYKIGLYPMGMGYDDAIEALRWERRLELANEGHRFYDLVRWGIAKDYINNYISTEKNRRAYLEGAHLEEHEYYLPVPQIELDASNGVYTQRVGY